MAQYYDTTPWLIPKADDRLGSPPSSGSMEVFSA